MEIEVEKLGFELPNLEKLESRTCADKSELGEYEVVPKVSHLLKSSVDPEAEETVELRQFSEIGKTVLTGKETEIFPLEGELFPDWSGNVPPGKGSPGTELSLTFSKK